MRIVPVVLLSAFVAGLPPAKAAQVRAASTTFIADAETVPLSVVLKKIEKRYGVHILYSIDDIRPYRVPSKLMGKTVNEALDNVLLGLPITYSVKVSL